MNNYLASEQNLESSGVSIFFLSELFVVTENHRAAVEECPTTSLAASLTHPHSYIVSEDYIRRIYSQFSITMSAFHVVE